MADRVTITRDSFLEPLGISGVDPRTPEQADLLYRLTVEYAASAGAVEELPESATGMGELPLRLPGGVTLSLANLDLTELNTLLALTVAVVGTAFPPAGIGLASIVMLRKRLRVLRREYGERSVVDAVASTSPATARDVTLALFGKPCRYPDAGCRFLAEASGTCGIGLDAVTTTLDSLVEKDVLTRRNAVEPIEYGVAL